MANSSKNNRAALEKSFSPLQVWALALGCILGWGCFMLPALHFLPKAGPIAAAVGFFIGGGMLCFVALSYGKLIENYPVAGGSFTYTFVGFGPTFAFICGWALVLGYICIIALNVTAIALLTRFMLPGVFQFGELYTIAGWSVQFGEVVMLCSVAILFGWINMRGVAFAGSLQVILAVALLFGVVVIATGSFVYSGTELANLQPYSNEKVGWLASIATIVAIAPWLYVGFDTIPQTAEEFNFPHEKSTMLMIVAILCGAAVYAIVTISIASIMPYQELLAMDLPWHTGYVTSLTLKKWGAITLAVAVLGAILTGINGFFIASSRLIFSMARSQMLPKWFGEIDPKHQTPANAIRFCIFLCLFAPWFGREVLGWIVDMSSIGTIIAYGFACLAAYRLASRTEMVGAGAAKVYAILGSLASLGCLLLLTLPMSPASVSWQSWIALCIWIVLGIIFYFAKARKIHELTVDEQCFLILGDKNKKVFFTK